MSDNTTFRLKFWGTRGSIACPGPDTVKYGGNTTCFEVTCGSRRIIIDAGTGIRALGKKIMLEEGNTAQGDCLKELFFEIINVIIRILPAIIYWRTLMVFCDP